MRHCFFIIPPFFVVVVVVFFVVVVFLPKQCFSIILFHSCMHCNWKKQHLIRVSHILIQMQIYSTIK